VCLACRSSTRDSRVGSRVLWTATRSRRSHQRGIRSAPGSSERSLERKEKTDVRTEPRARRWLKSSLIDATVDRMEGSKNPEICVLHARRFRHRFANGTGTGLPSQHQPPSPYSTLGIVIPCRAKFDILRRLVTRKDPLHPFVELSGEIFQVPEGVEFGIPPQLWSRIWRSVRE